MTESLSAAIGLVRAFGLRLPRAGRLQGFFERNHLLDSVWTRRQKATRAKLASGPPISLAEVISDGAHRYHGEATHLSLHERELYLKARRLLADEIGQARGINAAQAEDWITAQLGYANAQ